MQKLYGAYPNSKEAGKAVEELKKLNYTIEEIHAYTKQEFDNLDISNYKDRKVLENYRKNLKENQIIVLVDVKDGEVTKAPDWDEREREFYEDLED